MDIWYGFFKLTLPTQISDVTQCSQNGTNIIQAFQSDINDTDNDFQSSFVGTVFTTRRMLERWLTVEDTNVFEIQKTWVS